MGGKAAQGAEVSQPGEPAEQEADAVADHAAESLHGGGAPKGAAEVKQQAPAIGAKLDGTKIHLAGKDPLRGQKKDQMGTGPEANAMHVGNAVQAGVQASPQHHVLPQAERSWFKERGVNVDDYCVTIEKDHHDAVHAKPSPKDAKAKGFNDAKKWEWNAQVMTALRDAEAAARKKLKPDDILRIVKGIMPAYGLKEPFEKYKGAK